MSKLNCQVAPDGARLGAAGIAIASGKGGVGKTNVVANLAASLAKAGRSVLLVDADFGLGNLDVLLGLSPRFHIGHVLTGERSLDEVIVDGPAGMRILPAASGLPSLTAMTAAHRELLRERIETAARDVDFVLFDTSAGISENVTGILAASVRTIVVTNPEPTSLVDAYALIKVMQRLDPSLSMELLVNSVSGDAEARAVHAQLGATTERFLSLTIDLFGWVARDPLVQSAVRDQELVVLRHPQSRASQSFSYLAEKLDAQLRPRAARPARVLSFPGSRESDGVVH